MKSWKNSSVALLSLLALSSMTAVLTTGCAQEEEAPPPTAAPAPQRVENAESSLALADVPEGFTVASNDADGIVLTRKPELPPGEVTVHARPVQEAGVNLVKEVNTLKTEFEGRPEGVFNGQAELGGLAYPAYSTRGRWTEDGRAMEAIHLVTLHGTQNRVVDVIYAYEQSGDTKDRMEQAMAVLGEVEPYDADAAMAEDAAGEAGDEGAPGDDAPTDEDAVGDADTAEAPAE